MKDESGIMKMLSEEERRGLRTGQFQDTYEELATSGQVLEDMPDKSIAIFEEGIKKSPDEDEIHYIYDDIQLIHKLNKAANRGNSLQEIIELLCSETKRIFSSSGATVYLLSNDKKSLLVQNISLIVYNITYPNIVYLIYYRFCLILFFVHS